MHSVLHHCPSLASASHITQISSGTLNPQARYLLGPAETASNEHPALLDDSNFRSCHSSTCMKLFSSQINPQSESSRGKDQRNKFIKHYSRKRRREDTPSPPSKKRTILSETSRYCEFETEGVALNGSEPTAATVWCSATEIAGESKIAASKSPVGKDRIYVKQQTLTEPVDDDMEVRQSLQCSVKQMFNGTSSSEVRNGIVHEAVVEIEATRANATAVLKNKEDEEVCMSTLRVCEAINLDTEDRDGLNSLAIANTDCFQPQPCNNMDIEESRHADCPALDVIDKNPNKMCENQIQGSGLADLTIVIPEATAILSKQVCIGMDIEESRWTYSQPSQMNNFTGVKICKDQIGNADVAVAGTKASACFSKQAHGEVGTEKESRQAYDVDVETDLRQVGLPTLQMNNMREHDVAEVKVADPLTLELPKSIVKSKSSLRQKVDNNGKHIHKSLKSKILNMENQAAAGAAATSLAVCAMPASVAELPSSLKQPIETKTPSFEGFIVEAVEGSGGFGTVYKAVRKSDGTAFAIKCPFEKTSAVYVSNEIKVLRKYGGRYSIPQCIDVIEESGRQCLVLDFIEHEKPEVLKKEISISALRWYGYTLFRALAYLHDKGVIHRDVKPGNFLFSCQKNCGSLVDFNLAVVQPKQPSSASKFRRQPTGEEQLDRTQHESKRFRGTEANLNKANKVSVGGPKSLSVRHTTDGYQIKHAETGHLQGKAATPGTPIQAGKQSSQPTLSTLSQARHPDQVTPKLNIHKPFTAESRHRHAMQNFLPVSSHRTSPGNGRQYADIEAASPVLKELRLHSVSHLSPSNDQKKISQINDIQFGEQAKEPLPRLGRRELLEYVEKARHSPQPQVASLSSSLKKRVAAPQKRKHQKSSLDRLPRRSTSPVSKFSYLKQPIAGQSTRARGILKKKKEGQCAGTKGYRAPEVLLKSVFQSEKIDIWSAGVSLFQLLLGKQPFSSSSNIEQSLIDIAQFCGADAISMLAREHHREDCLPKELTTVKLPPTSVHIWCQKNTKRSDLLALVPTSLYDLIEKCLQVNPRNRISAKEALKQEFFTPCRETVNG